MWTYDPLCDTWHWTAPPPRPRRPKRAVFRTWRCNYPACDGTASQERLRELAARVHWTNVVWRSGTDHIVSVSRDPWDMWGYNWLQRWRNRYRPIKNPGPETGAEEV